MIGMHPSESYKGFRFLPCIQLEHVRMVQSSLWDLLGVMPIMEDREMEIAEWDIVFCNVWAPAYHPSPLVYMALKFDVLKALILGLQSNVMW